MHINASKTKLVVFGTKKTREQLSDRQLTLAGVNITEEDAYKYLGVILDNTLNMNNHAEKVSITANFRIRTFRKIRHLLSIHSALLIFKSTILPQLEYGNLFYNSANKNILADIQISQNKAIKCALYLPKLSRTKDIHKVAKLETLHIRYITDLSKLAFYRAKLPEFLAPVTAGTRSQDAPLMHLTRVKRSASIKSLTYRVAHFWNNLPVSARLMDNYALYKNHIADLIPRYEPP